ncbi:PREDICTED: uncharacterized protein LOC106792986 [Polistes canadensis]|uniref:uncharacterized protein LOC106792986 n=1 Tax=Polistes canadensis TaxID=91411 RepID=UPI000718D11F|nr:PREDICTED: uncharacterized protein LOC106792986 [Polistes canadensis]
MSKSVSSVCQRKSSRCLKIPLKSTEQIYLVFLIPTLVNCIVYIIHFSADLVVATQHFREHNPVWGSCTLSLMYAPAIVYFILTISRPDWWMTDNDKLTKGILIWLFVQICQLIGFPFFALYRYAGLIVMAVDAIILTGEKRSKTLNISTAPAAIELYFFLQAWFQAAPQAIFQTHLLFREYTVQRSFQSISIHVLCILMSVVILAIETTSFQRFESQRVNGRKLPWAMWLKKYCIKELQYLEEKTPLQLSNVTEDNNTAAINLKEESNQPDENVNKSTEQKAETEAKEEAAVTLDRQISVTPPLPPKNAHVIPPPTPLRGITTVVPLPVPDVPAPPRPDSIVKTSENQDVENSKSISIIEPNQKLTNSNQSLKVPKRKHSSKGLDEDDPVGKFLSFLWWFFFILARILTISIFYEFYPYYLLGTLSIHYIIMLVYLFYYASYYDVITFFINLWLGLVYIISMIEYKIKFKYADKWLLPYYIFIIIQNTVFTLTWYLYAEFNGFWYNYAVCTIFISMALCISSTIVYHVLFKPKKRRIYSS